MRSTLIFSIISLITACQSGKNTPGSPPEPFGKSGEELAHIHCSGCHLFPEPALLSRKSWKDGVLPEMAYRLGVRPFTEKLGDFSPDELDVIVQSGNYPLRAVVAEEDWQKIVDYYVKNAPEVPVPQVKKTPVSIDRKSVV